MGVTPALAEGQSNVQVAPRAQWLDSGWQIIVDVTYQCDGGLRWIEINVAQSTTLGSTEGRANTLVMCDGAPHKTAVSISPQVTYFCVEWDEYGNCMWMIGFQDPPFRVGNAQASAVLWGQSVASDTRAIRIR